MTPELQRIEQRRMALRVSRTQLAAAAGIPLTYYSGFLIAGRRKPRPATISRLNTALDNLRKARGRRDGADFALTVAVRLAIVVVALTQGHDPLDAQADDPARRATQSPDWICNAAVRRLAAYLLVTECGFSQSDVATAAGMTRQNMSELCAQIGAQRDDGNDLDVLAGTIGKWIMGERK